jgi:uncharacterized membrane protein HdeD (DUF308 family)
VFTSLWSSLLWRGLAAVVIGVVSVAWPAITVGAFVILFAVYAFVSAGMEAARAFSGDRAGPAAGFLLLAGLSVAGGLVALVWPDITALALTAWVGVWAVVTGAIEVALAIRVGDTTGDRAMWGLRGLVSLALGLVLLIRPDIGALTLATVFGLFSIVYGAAAVALSLQIRHLATASEINGAPV